MVKTFKFKLLIVSMVLLAIITSITAFSVSYAKWVANDNTTVSGSADVGVWDGDVPVDPPQDKFTLYQDKDRTTVLQISNFVLVADTDYSMIFSFTVTLKPGEKFWFYLNGQDEPVSYPVNSGNHLLEFRADEGCYCSVAPVELTLRIEFVLSVDGSGLWVDVC